MEMLEMNEQKEFYELVTWAVIIGINFIMMFFAYWLADIAYMMQHPLRRRVTYALSVTCATIGIWRMIAIVIYFDSFTARLAIPISAAIAWLVIAAVGFIGHRYIKSVHARYVSRKENIDLMEAVQNEVVIPILQGQPLPLSVITRHKKASADYAISRGG